MRQFLDDTRYLWLAVAAAFLLLGGCYSGSGGCSVNDKLTAEAGPPAKPAPPEYEAQSVREYNMGAVWVLKDQKHDCEYVVINSAIFVWRGTNLIAYTHKE